MMHHFLSLNIHLRLQHTFYFFLATYGMQVQRVLLINILWALPCSSQFPSCLSFPQMSPSYKQFPPPVFPHLPSCSSIPILPLIHSSLSFQQSLFHKFPPIFPLFKLSLSSQQCPSSPVSPFLPVAPLS